MGGEIVQASLLQVLQENPLLILSMLKNLQSDAFRILTLSGHGIIPRFSQSELIN